MVPSPTPVTTPVEEIVNISVSPLDHVPDTPLPVSVLVRPSHTESVPEMVGSA